MRPQNISAEEARIELFRSRFENNINMKHQLVLLADQIKWSKFEDYFGQFYRDKKEGHPPKPIRLMIGLLVTEYMFKLSDYKIIQYFTENPYIQYFCGYERFHKDPPIQASTLVRFRNRIGEEGVRKIFQSILDLAIALKIIEKNDLQEVLVDTTVMPKNIAYPTDSALIDKAREKLVKLSQKHEVPLRQNYNQLAKKEKIKVARYAHAKQFKPMNKSLKTLRTYLGRIVRDIERKIEEKQQLHPKFRNNLDQAKKLLEQTKTTQDKLYSLHEPGVKCIAKGKAKTPYKFGSKVPIVSSAKKKFHFIH